MRGDIYSNMPDTTSQVSPASPYRRPLRRLTAATLLFVSSLLLVASIGLAQGGSTVFDIDPSSAICEDFDSPEAAADFALDQPDAELALDSDGNGIVCDEDPELFTDGFEDTFQEDTFQEDTYFEDTYQEDTVEDLNVDDEYADDSYVETPNTGGIALLPLAGSMLTACLGGFMLIRRR